MKHLRKFNTEAEYSAYYGNVAPLVALISESRRVVYKAEAELPLHFIALEDTTISFSLNTVQYSFDRNEWSSLAPNASTPTVKSGKVIYFKAENLTPVAVDGIGTFSFTGKCDVAGNILSMLYGDSYANKDDVALPQYAFRKMFAYTSNLRNASNLRLPSINLAYQCYNGLFYQSGITNAPELPADTMAQECYRGTFQDCANLQDAPALPATTLASNCYQAMFAGAGIKSIVLPATTLASNCYKEMLQRCTALSYVKMMAIEWDPTVNSSEWMKSMTVSNGTFVKNSAATWDNLFGISAIPTGWTVELADA